MTLKLITPPNVEPLTAAEAKARLNIGDEVYDDVMSALIKAARQMIDGRDGWLGRAFITQTWDLVIDRFSGWNRPLETGFYGSSGYGSGGYDYDRHYACQQHQGIVIPLPPLQSVTSVKYLDADGIQQTLDPATYVVEQGEPSHLVLATGAAWPTVSPIAGAVTVRFIAGYGTTGSDVPETIRMAIALQVSHLRSLTAQNLFISSETTDGIDAVGYTVSGNAGGVIAAASQALLCNLRVWT